MTKKQKQMVVRIVIAFVMLAAIMISEHTGLSERIQPQVLLALICLIPYLIIGYDILYKAARNIRNGQVFDENFLMMIATFGAFGVGEYSEAVAVMLFYQVGELFQGYAVGKSRQSISDVRNTRISRRMVCSHRWIPMTWRLARSLSSSPVNVCRWMASW